MPTIQSLKKQLKGVRSTQKLTKAMKTVSTVKFSRLNDIFNKYSEYGKQCKKMFEQYGDSFLEFLPETDSKAPVLVVVIASNKGLCGSFNAEIFKFARQELSKNNSAMLITCGKKAAGYFRDKNIPALKEVILNDIPSFEQSSAFLDEIIELRLNGTISGVKVIYPKYINMLKQAPVCFELFRAEEYNDEPSVLYVPDKKTITQRMAKTVFYAMFHQIVLESAIGAQAATLMTMRSAYDTATDYYMELEGEINRLRQSTVTADVIETSAERSE